MSHPWRLEHRRGSAQDLHDLAATEPISGRVVVIQEATSPALVVGSAQRLGETERARAREAGIEVARRRSGGGAVLLVPGDHVWVDLVIGADDPLADADVGRAAWWVGEAFLRSIGLGARPVGAEVHRGGVTDRAAGAIACFAALGPGEVALEGRKVLGISQRRTRSGARFQCLAYRDWEPRRLLSLLSLPPDRSAVVPSALLDRAGAGLAPGWGVVEDLLPSLP
ncbi:MAG: hypothetical protein JST64_12145 [Actinobacteria bacterium]|nr:hypothetical protein [Actinomycetota bacterium]